MKDVPGLGVPIPCRGGKGDGKEKQVWNRQLNLKVSCCRYEVELIDWEKSNKAGVGKYKVSTEINVLISWMDLVSAKVCC